MKKGFTLIELLIVIVIASMLLGLSAFGARNARQSARDDKRLADLQAIRSGLARYRADCGSFPLNLPSAGTSLIAGGNCLSSNTYIEVFPEDPEGFAYHYEAFPSGGPPFNEYVLCAKLTVPPNPAQNTALCGNNCNGQACNVIYTN